MLRIPERRKALVQAIAVIAGERHFEFVIVMKQRAERVVRRRAVLLPGALASKVHALVVGGVHIARPK